MGQYTIDSDASLDKMITRQLDIATKLILRYTTPLSIFLVGSFGRGEGTVIKRRREYVPICDYDLLLVVSKNLRKSYLEDLEKLVNRELSLELAADELSRGGSVTLSQQRYPDLLYIPFLKNVELKYASRILYGKDIRSNIRTTPDNMAPYSGFMIICENAVGLVAAVASIIQNQESQTLVNAYYSCLKCYLAIGTALSYAANCYAPTFKERADGLSELRLRSFHGDLAALIDRVVESTNVKLKFDVSRCDLSTVMRTSVRLSRDIILALWYYVSRVYGLGVEVDQLATSYYDVASRVGFSDMTYHYLKLRFGVSMQPVARLLAYLHSMRTSLLFFVNGRRMALPVSLSVLTQNVQFRVYHCAIILLNSLGKEEETRHEEVTLVWRELGRILKLPYLPSSRDFRDEFLIVARLLLKVHLISCSLFYMKG